MNRSLPGIDHDVQTILLDVDGTLVASNDAHAESWVRAFAEAGIHVAFERVRPLMGMGGDTLLPEIEAGLTSEDEPGKTIARRRGEIFKEHFLHTIEATPGARELLETFKRMGFRCAIATSAKPGELEPMLKRANLSDLIDDATTSQDAERSKPSPDIVTAALAKIKAEPRTAVMLGDTKFDIEAAKQAGVPTIALSCGGASEADLAGAVAVFDDPADLNRHLKPALVPKVGE